MPSHDSQASLDSFVRELLGRLLRRYEDNQIFLFGPEGDPFWAAEVPVTGEKLHVLDAACTLIEQLEKERPKPFIGHDRDGRFSLAALSNDSDLYVVVVHAAPEHHPPMGEARAMAMRDALLSEMHHLRNPELRAVALTSG